MGESVAAASAPRSLQCAGFLQALPTHSAPRPIRRCGLSQALPTHSAPPAPPMRWPPADRADALGFPGPSDAAGSTAAALDSASRTSASRTHDRKDRGSEPWRSPSPF
ncbi:hypothetical protein GCM10025331_37080 [Actinoplanes utahensis]|nr:hypothetical protein Aut01nite_46620 [Actinoplanes utahensis]